MRKARTSWSVRLPIIFGAIVLSFAAATAFTQWQLTALDRAAVEIADNSAPSVERLAAARDELRRLQSLLREYLDQRIAGATASTELIEESDDAMDRALDEYLRLPVFPGEHTKWAEILEAKATVDEAVKRCVSRAERGDLPTAVEVARGDVSRAADRLATAITLDIAFNAGHSRDLALRIETLRGRSMRIAFDLLAACAVITFGAAIALQRAIRAHSDLAERHRRLLEARASELEQFAGRIAHDILSPLGAVAFALEAGSRSNDEQTRVRCLNRGTNALLRVRRLVDGLLEFARAGARPDPFGCSDVRSTIADLLEEISGDAAKVGATLAVTVEDGVDAVVCNPGVLTSLVANLAQNAIKYLGAGPIRRIAIRALDRGTSVRVEVEDTGPGLPPGLEEHVFEPYVRGPHSSEAGIGLGLATVKRLVEAHHGTTGVRSVPGTGCTFWFELRKAIRPAPQRVPTREHVPSIA